MQKGGTVYIMSNTNNRVLYTGVTANLFFRVSQHKEKSNPESFTAKYNCTKLVYHEPYPTIEEAIAEEKRIKGGNRKAKENLITSRNPKWKDLWEDIKNW